MQADPRRLTGQRIDNRYEIGDVVGEGGMAIVYRARDLQTGGAVAIKVILPALIQDAAAMARLRREAALGAKLSHPNLSRIDALHESESLTYVVMPFLDGEPLVERVFRAGQLDLLTVSGIVRELAAGLHVAHELGAVHRDLKPENVLLVRDADGSERAVLLDFGLALAGGSRTRLTRTGMVVGTPDFMSPEQMRGAPLDPRSDIYSLALMTNEMLTGKSPFSGTTLREVAVARMKGALIPLSVQRPDLVFPPAVEGVLVRALAVKPDDRYPTAPAFAADFERAASPAGV